MPLDPQARSYLEATAALAQPPLSSVTPAEARRMTEDRAAALAGPPEPVWSVENRILDTPEGAVPVRIYRPTDTKPLPCLVWFHGGGWVVGSLDTHDAACRAVALRGGCAVIAVDYRLAPEHPYPAAVADCWTAVTWVAEHAVEIGVDSSRLAVGGDSAGGNLAAAMALRAVERGHPRLALQVLVYPVTDVDTNTESYRANGEDYGLTRDSMRWYVEQYAPNPRTHRHADLAPLRAPSVRGVAPAFVITCEYDPLLTEGEAYAARLSEAGVATTLIREPGMIHGYFRWAGTVDRALKSYDDIGAALRKAFTSD